jgi:hypothetical protein
MDRLQMQVSCHDRDIIYLLRSWHESDKKEINFGIAEWNRYLLFAAVFSGSKRSN